MARFTPDLDLIGSYVHAVYRYKTGEVDRDGNPIYRPIVFQNDLEDITMQFDNMDIINFNPAVSEEAVEAFRNAVTNLDSNIQEDIADKKLDLFQYMNHVANFIHVGSKLFPARADIPTKLSQMINDAGYLKQDDPVPSASKADVATKLETSRSFSIIGKATATAKYFNGTGDVVLKIDTVNADKDIDGNDIATTYVKKTQIVTGDSNGTINVSGTDISVRGLKSGAYADAYVHPTTAGNKHIPAGGSNGQILKYSSSGTATWANEYSYTHPTTAGNKHIPTGGSSGQVLKYGGSSGTASWGTLTASDVGALASNGTAVKATADANGNNIASTYATKDEVSAIPKFTIQVVQSLPTTNISPTTVYLLATDTESQNMYTEYIYVNNKWEKLGTQNVDLSEYALKSDITTGSTNGTIAVAGTNVAVKGLKSGAYADKYEHPTTAGNKHIPSGGSSGQVLKYSASGTATWATLTAADVGAAPSTIDTGVMSVATGSTNGTLSVDGTDVAVKGLGSAAFINTPWNSSYNLVSPAEWSIWVSDN